MTVSRGEVEAALREVTFGRERLTESGRLSDIVIGPEGRVSFSIAVEPTEASAAEPIRQAAADAVRLVAGVSDVFASLTADRPASSGRHSSPGASHSHGRAPGPPQPRAVDGVARIIAVASGKGGVGKSTVACNLALALAARGLSVGLLDADIYGPSVPKLFGLDRKKPRVISGRIIEPLKAYGIQVMSIGFLVDEEAAMIWRGPMVMSAINQLLREVAWDGLDVMIVDMPPGTGDAQLTMAQSVPLAGAVIVSTPQDLALSDARRGIAMFKRTEVPILGIVENMASFACPNCGAVSHVFGHGGARREAERLAIPFLGEVLLDMAIRETSDSGKPVVATAPDGLHALAFRAIAATLWDVVEGRRARAAPRIVME